MSKEEDCGKPSHEHGRAMGKAMGRISIQSRQKDGYGLVALSKRHEGEGGSLGSQPCGHMVCHCWVGSSKQCFGWQGLVGCLLIFQEVVSKMRGKPEWSRAEALGLLSWCQLSLAANPALEEKEASPVSFTGGEWGPRGTCWIPRSALG